MGGANPMVAAYQDDLDSSDEDQSPIVNINSTEPETMTKPVSAPKIASADVVLSSDEEEREIPELESSESEDNDDDGHNTIEKLQEQFSTASLTNKEKEIPDSISPTVAVSNSDLDIKNGAPAAETEDHDNNDSDSSDQAPVVMTFNEDFSDDDLTKQAPANSRKAPAISGVSSKDVVLTDSDDDRPHVMATEELSDSDTAEHVSSN